MNPTAGPGAGGVLPARLSTIQGEVSGFNWGVHGSKGRTVDEAADTGGSRDPIYLISTDGAGVQRPLLVNPDGSRERFC